MSTIIAFHGFNQDPSYFENTIRKVIPKNFKLLILPGPIVLPEGTRAYYYFNQSNPLDICWDDKENPIGIEDSVNGFLSTVKNLEKVILLGFSQGGMFVDYLISKKIFVPEKAIFICTKKGLFETDNENVPSLHIYGKMDSIIPCEQSIYLSEKYKNSKIVEHPNRHVIPNSSLIRNSIKDFLNSK